MILNFCFTLTSFLYLFDTIIAEAILQSDDENNISWKKSDSKYFSNQRFASYDPSSKDKYKRVCVYPNWSTIRESNVSQLIPEYIDPFLCTHIHYAYANIDLRSLQLTPAQQEDNKNGTHGDVIFKRSKFKYITQFQDFLLYLFSHFMNV